MALTLTELNQIAAIARERHFGCAAGASVVSQPTLRVAIEMAEDEPDAKNSERGASDVSVQDTWFKRYSSRLLGGQSRHSMS